MEPAIPAIVRHIHEKNRVELAPKPTGMAPHLQIIGKAKALLFDIYGTLLVSGSGDVGTVLEQSKSEAFAKALKAAGVSRPKSDIVSRAQELFFVEIRKRHAFSQKKGIDYPEVDILEVWEAVLGSLSLKSDKESCVRTATTYEVHANPVCLMPGAKATIAELKSTGLQIGIVSNAQFFTETLLEYELGSALPEAGFNPSLCAYSYRAGAAKPSTALFSPVVELLSEVYGIEPSSVVYLGNDMLNDIFTAAAVGCRTCLFAGDLRSLRLRRDHELCAQIKPDAVITELAQLPRILSL